jgi:hypothetical protein
MKFQLFTLQNLFSIIRGRNGFNEKPELTAFVGALRSVAASGLAQPDSAGRNCEDDGCTAAVTSDLLPSFILQAQVAAQVFNAFAATGISFPSCEVHSAQVERSIFNVFASLRLHHWCRNQMRSLRVAAAERRAMRKFKKFN